jgi:peroxiredoxin
VRKINRVLFFVLFVLLACSLTVNALQIRRILALQEGVDKLSVRGALALGAKVPGEFSARDQDGREAIIRFASSSVPTVLYVFRPSCVWCQRNSQSVNALAEQTAGRYRLVGLTLSVDGLAEFVKEHRFPFPVYSDIPLSVVNALRLGATPQTIVVSPSATVLEDWTGAYTGIQKSLAESFFSIRLPEVPSPAQQM